MNKHLKLLADTEPESLRKTLAITWRVLKAAVHHSLLPDFIRQVLKELRLSMDADELLIVTGPADKRSCYHLWMDNNRPAWTTMHNAPPIERCADAEVLFKKRRHKLQEKTADPEKPPYAHCVRLHAGDTEVGTLILARSGSVFREADRTLADMVGDSLSIAMLNFQNRTALAERVKELTCLYRCAQIASVRQFTVEEVLQQVVDLIPPAWHYPEITAGCIEFDRKLFQTSNFTTRPVQLTADLIVNGQKRGNIHVVYLKNMPLLDEGPFLREERNLLNTLAQQLSVAIERREAEAEQQRLHNQLLHADRLATIGKLAAGVAHELNEPLGNVLGFAQLISREPDVTEQIRSDIGKIEAAALHGREIVRKLMLFARQTPPRKEPANLNRIVEQAISLIENRLSRGQVELKLALDESIHETVLDVSQFVQVIINLVVNAVQAMPDGGTIRIQTTPKGDHFICLTVTDTGGGMAEDVQEQAFLPFFTTKDVHEGTGLGLAVVHGIVTAHAGSIELESSPGEGTTFRITIPVTGQENEHHE